MGQAFSAGYDRIVCDGVSLPRRRILEFLNAASCDTVGSHTVIDLPTGGGGGGGGIGTEETPAGTRPGDTFTTSVAYASVLVWLNGFRLRPVVSPGVGEFDYSGSTLTTGDMILASDWLTLIGVTSGTFMQEDITGTGLTFTTVNAYTSPIVTLNGVRQKPVAVPGRGEFHLSGTALTMGTVIVSGDWLHVEGT